jgi:hypothetical protein
MASFTTIPASAAASAAATQQRCCTEWAYTTSVVAQRLERMVEASRDIYDHASFLAGVMVGSRHGTNRGHAVRWIKEVAGLSQMSPDARDTSVQIFDRYFGRHLQLDSTAFNNPEVFSTVAAVAVLLSSKFHESCPLSMSSFATFTPETLSRVENDVLVMLDYNIVPLATPTSFIHHMLLLWPQSETGPTGFLASVSAVSCRMVGEFWESPTSCRYAPSTIALAALLLAFSTHRVDCSRWLLECVPDACMPKGESDSEMDAKLLDIDGCLLELQRVCCSRKSKLASVEKDKDIEKDNAELGRLDSNSPISVADTFRTATPVAETEALSLSDKPSPSSVHSPPKIVSPIGSPEGRTGKRIKLF